MRKRLVIFLLLSIFPSFTNVPSVRSSGALVEPPSFMELAKQADLILIGKVTVIEVREYNTVTFFEISEYIKEWESSPEFTLKLSGGTKRVTSPASPTFEIGEEYLLFLIENSDKSYYLLFDHYGKPLMSSVNITSLNTVREFYGSVEIANTLVEKNLIYSPFYLLIAFLSIILIIIIIYGRVKVIFP